MSTRKKKNATAPASATPDPAPDTAAAAPDSGSGAPGVPVLRNDTDTALWAALGTHPGSTTAALADVAGIGVSTARRALMSWETAGAARSHSDPESPRAAKTWTTVEPAAAPEPVAEVVTTSADSAEPADDVPADPGQADTPVAGPVGDESTDTTPVAPAGGDDPAAAQPESGPRLRSGALRGQVEDFLRDHPDADFSPHQIGKALNRSSGAVHNALVTLTKGGTAHQTSTAPKRFALASADTTDRSGNPGHQPETPAN